MIFLRLPHRFLLLVLAGLLTLPLAGQNCGGRITGTLTDEHDGEALPFATVYVLSAGFGVQADAAGRFELSGVCPGPVTLRFSHLGCDPLNVAFDFRRDTALTVSLHHHENYTETVTVTTGAASGYGERLDARADRQLGEVLEGINGVSTLRTGTAAAKPVYDGLFGNRLSLQNNGVAQAGQQWGNDHAPEIDPWVAAYVRVIDGPDALRYAGSTLGPTVLIEPAELTPNTASRGRAAYALRANGRAHALNARLTDTTRWFSYRLSGSLKYAGDQRAPDYFLSNTGRREGNLAVQFAKFFPSGLTTRLYYSLFNAEIGVLRGSHIGNLSDLEEAIGRETPFFTEPDFSYAIGSPRQGVGHHLLKAELEYRPADGHRYGLIYGGQLNDRREYDVRRGDDDRPALQLLQQTHTLEGTHHREFGGEAHLDAGLQLGATDNTNQPGTGVLPLIPDYNDRRAAGYLIYRRELARLRYHVGLRYDYQFYEAITISRDLPLRVERFRHRFGTPAASLDLHYRPGRRLSYRLDLSYRERAPRINELYSQGLHQGVSGIEEGDAGLLPERSLKLRLGGRYTNESGRVTLNVSAFAQRVANFINLEPEDEFRLTIRGAFPVFRYRGVDAALLGANLSLLAQLGERLDLDARFAAVGGRNRTDDRALIYLPPANLRTQLTYRLPGDLSVGLSSYLSLRRSDVGADQDFLPPPPAYALFGLEATRSWRLAGERELSATVSAENLLDTAYRDYLDRQRYFADAPGRSINLRVAYGW